MLTIVPGMMLISLRMMKAWHSERTRYDGNRLNHERRTKLPVGTVASVISVRSVGTRIKILSMIDGRQVWTSNSAKNIAALWRLIED